MESNAANDYKPLKTLINSATAQLEVLDPASAKSIRTMVYTQVKQIDDAVKGAIPDELYAYLNR